MIDSRAAMRGKQIEILYARGRHLGISCISSTQAYKEVLNTVRFNCEHELVWKLRNGQDLDAWLQENPAIVGQGELMEIYRKATSVPYGYLWLNKSATDDNNLFHVGLGAPGEQIAPTKK